MPDDSRLKNGVLNGLFVLMALSTLGMVAKTLTLQPSPPPPDGTKLGEVELANWQQYAKGGHILGAAAGRDTLIVFGDFECPACRRFATGTLDSLLAKYPTDLTAIFRHWPLAYHKHAYPAARAAECVVSLGGSFESFHNFVYQFPDSLESEAFLGFARASGVTDLGAFAACGKKTDSLPTIKASSAAAREAGGRGTPTLILNGTLFRGVPRAGALESHLKSAPTKAQ